MKDITELIENVSLLSETRILRLQTTFLELECRASSMKAATTFRVHFENKHEFKLNAGAIQSLKLEIHHPLLLQYHQPICPLQLVSEVTDKACFLNQLDAATNAIFLGWRQAVDYCFMPPEKFIEKGYGILMEAPKPYVDAVAESAKSCAVELVAGKSRIPVAPLAQVLLMDEMYVIADGFRIEEVIKKELHI
jgi:hypothetical protein